MWWRGVMWCDVETYSWSQPEDSQCALLVQCQQRIIIAQHGPQAFKLIPYIHTHPLKTNEQRQTNRIALTNHQLGFGSDVIHQQQATFGWTAQHPR